MKKILITGAAGFFGRRFVNFYKNKYEIIDLERKDLDITNEDKVIEKIRFYKPDYVLHTAAIADTKFCENNPLKAYKINVLGSINVAKATKEVNGKLIYLSSEQIFNGNLESGPYSEDTLANPNTVYGKNKLEAEGKIKDIIDEVWILRLTWLFGFPEKNAKVNPNIIMNVLNATLKNKKTKFPLNEYRGMTYVYDLIQNIEKIFNIPYGIYNTGSENNLSTYETSCVVLKELGLNHRINEIIEKDEEKFKEIPRDLRINNEKLRDLNIIFMSTEEGIKKCIEDFHYKIF
ncbi:SDR family oxidoreductase [Haloimpatiens sp. FM7315]|uniref:SDR family oxidoreductase n=1 Tax=Haloimpatiens sp. FM7315 TaxID=3298609 RepID=UPI00370A734D